MWRVAFGATLVLSGCIDIGDTQASSPSGSGGAKDGSLEEASWADASHDAGDDVSDDANVDASDGPQCSPTPSVSGSASSTGSFASITASGNTLTFGWCNTGNQTCGYSADITLGGFTATGSVSGARISGVSASGNTITVSYCNDQTCGMTGSITLVGAIASGSTSGDQLMSLTASGNTLSFQSCYTGSQSCGYGGDLTLECAP